MRDAHHKAEPSPSCPATTAQVKSAANEAATVGNLLVSGDGAVLGAAWQRLNRSALGPAFTAASTLLGVAQLGFPGQLIEVDLTAALSA
jgi:hypothetical protein